jgi:hypothetical protein
VIAACVEARQAARAIGGLREKHRRCKPGSSGALHYATLIEGFERQEWAAADALNAILIEAQTASEDRR